MAVATQSTSWGCESGNSGASLHEVDLVGKRVIDTRACRLAAHHCVRHSLGGAPTPPPPHPSPPAPPLPLLLRAHLLLERRLGGRAEIAVVALALIAAPPAVLVVIIVAAVRDRAMRTARAARPCGRTRRADCVYCLGVRECKKVDLPSQNAADATKSWGG